MKDGQKLLHFIASHSLEIFVAIYVDDLGKILLLDHTNFSSPMKYLLFVILKWRIGRKLNK